MQYLEKAGAILVRQGNGIEEILLEYRDRNYHDWTFPKGKVESGEAPEETAIRELKEETGYKIEIVGKLPDICYGFERSGESYSVRQHMFLAWIIDGHLTPEFKSDRLKWVSISEAGKMLTHQTLKDYLEQIKTNA